MKIVEQLKVLVARERELNVEILRKLREVEDSLIFARLGYTSMHEFCVRELGYSDGAAARRVQAMRLVRVNPAVETKLASGEINLGTAAELQRTFASAEKKNIELPREEMIAAVAGLSSREAEKVIHKQAVASGLKDPEDDEFLEGIKQLFAHYSHAHPGMNREKLLRVLVKEKVQSLGRTRRGKEQNSENRRPNTALRREIFARDENQCTFMSPGGRRCSATHFLELDHLVPVARGGLTKASNLRLRCRTHNQLTARNAGLFKRSGAGASARTARADNDPRGGGTSRAR